MNLKKALISSIILYALVFLAASALMFAVPVSMFGVTIVLLVAVLTFAISKYFYFKDVKIKNPLTDGIMLGVILVAVMFLIEIPVMVYGFSADLGWAYFMQWNLIVGYLLTLIMPVVAAYMVK